MTLLNMCTITLSYDGNNALAQQEIQHLLSTGRFIQIRKTDEEESPIENDRTTLKDEQKAILAKVKAMTDDEIKTLEEADLLSVEDLRLLLYRDIEEVYSKS